MKLVIDLFGFEQGRSYGFEEYILNLLTSFAKNRNQIKAEEIFVACQTSQVDFFKTKFGESFNYFTRKGSSYLLRFFNSAKLPSLLNLTRNDVILYPGNYMPILGRKSQVILVIHDLLFKHSEFCSKSISFTLFRLQRYIYIPQSIRRADVVIAISEYTRNEIISFYNTSPEKVVTIYNYFYFGKYDSSELRTITLIDKPFFLSICSGARHKNHEVMLRAFNEHCFSNKTDLFVLVGSLYPTAKEYYNTLSQDVRERIIFLSNISNSDINYLYSNAKGYISASLFEGLGMPVVEALYFNLPAYLSDTEIHREVSFGKAQYFNPLDWHSLAMLMAENSVPTDITSEINNRYSEQNTSGEYVNVINTLIGNSCN